MAPKTPETPKSRACIAVSIYKEIAMRTATLSSLVILILCCATCAEEPNLNLPKVYLYGNSKVAESKSSFDAFAVAEWEGFKLGYEHGLTKLKGKDAMAFDSYAAKIPVGNLLKTIPIDLYYFQTEQYKHGEREFKLIATPFKGRDELNLVLSYIELENPKGVDRGFTGGFNYRHGELYKENALGFGAAFARIGSYEEAGGYGWFMTKGPNPFLFGMGHYQTGNHGDLKGETRFVTGFPNTEGGFGLRLRGSIKEDGPRYYELILTPQGAELIPIDDFACFLRDYILRPDSADNRAVFKYRNPATNARGRDWVAFARLDESAYRVRMLDLEFDKYVGAGGLFVGAEYAARLDKYGKGEVSLPAGWAFNKGRNYIRIAPGYNIADKEWFLTASFEARF